VALRDLSRGATLISFTI